MTSIAKLLLASASLTLGAQTMNMQHQPADTRPVPLVQGLGNSNFRIHTSSAQAQRYFNQGLDYIWAFNHDEARRSFHQAALLDPKAAMPLWGEALAVSPNYNDIDIGHARARQAMKALERARMLAASGPALERDYIAALSSRYRLDAHGEPEVLGKPYSEAMGMLARRYPDDAEAATLYAESLMDLQPWKLWTPQGKPLGNAETIVGVLQGVLARHPDHIGANHLLIHATEASANPSIAMASAKRLESATPAAGHLMHMPAHTYQRVGNFDGAAAANERAVIADRTYFKSQHIENVANMYDSMYYTHNMHFLASSCSMEGNYACTARASRELVQHVVPEVKGAPGAEWYTPTEPWMLVRFEKWNEILAAPLPASNLHALTAMWHYARGCAFSALGQPAKARAERELLAQAPGTLPQGFPEDFNNPARSALRLALLALDARMQEAAGHRDQAIATWQQAVAELDTFAYNEPPDWYYPVRESLGGALLRDGKPKQAEAVFRRDLEINRGNGRSLFGLAQSLRAQHRDREAEAIQTQFADAWKHADTKLSVAGL